MNDKKNSNPRPSGGLNMADVYYVLFRRKWLILACSTIGFIVAATIYFERPAMFTSESTIEVKRIKDDMDPASMLRNGGVVDTTFGADGLINAELSILSSFDLAKRVASNAPARILKMYGGGDSVIAAANVIHESLGAERIPRSGIMRITLSFRDGEYVQSLLDTVINSYQSLHDEVHSRSDAAFKLKSESDDLGEKWKQIEGELLKKQKEAGVADIEGARKASAENKTKLQFDLKNVQWELNLAKAKLAKLKGDKGTAKTASTNTVAEPDIPKEKTDRYSQSMQLRDKLKKEYLDLLTTFSDQSTMAREKQAQITKAEEKIAALEKDEPRLARQKALASATGSNGTSTGDVIANTETQIETLEDHLKYDQTLDAEINANITNLDAAAADINDLEVKANIAKNNYVNATTQAAGAVIESSMQALNNANISIFDHPTPPAREAKKTPKMMGIAAASGVLGGIALAFLLELYVDHTVKRPKEVEGELGMRLFLSIPDMNFNGHRKSASRGKKKAKQKPEQEAEKRGGLSVVNGDAKLEIAPWDQEHPLHQYNESLRDRLISYFDINNLNHKPKLVAVTGSTQGAGTSTIAAGLAASLSETGDGNVLLVDMNLEHGAAQQFCMGKPACELDTALENDTRQSALIQSNLYVVSGSTSGGDKLSRMLPKNFANLMPKLKASDYDYIIFDMPPIARTGVTQRLSGFMDMMLLVVEAEKTSRDVVKQAGAALTQSKANVSVVLNKTHSYVPKRLLQEF